MKLLGLDHIGIVVRDIDTTVARAGDTVDGRAVGERFVSDNIDLQVLMAGKSTLELIEVRNAGFGMPRLKDGETAVIGHFGIEVDDLDAAKAELTPRCGPLHLHGATDDVRRDGAAHGLQGPPTGRVSDEGSNAGVAAALTSTCT